MRDEVMRIRADSDVKKSVGYLFFVLKKLKWPRIQLRGIGRAVKSMKMIIDKLTTDIKGYNIQTEWTKY